MKVKELIEKLSEFDPDKDVMVSVWSGDISSKRHIEDLDESSDNRPDGSATFVKVVIISLE